MTPIAITPSSSSTTATAATHTSVMSAPVAIHVVNPNSSSIITQALSESLSAQTPPGCTTHFVTGPPTAPESIQDVAGSIISAAETYRSLVSASPGLDLRVHPASCFLVACFSDHPLVGMLRSKANKPTMHLLEAAIIHALSVGAKFGVLTTGKSVVPDVEAGVRKVMGGNSDRYVGTYATGLGVVELQSGNREKVERKVKEGARELVRRGADVIILGCAGMTGMERLVIEGCAEEIGEGGEGVAVIDGARAGLQILAGLGRVNYRS